MNCNEITTQAFSDSVDSELLILKSVTFGRILDDASQILGCVVPKSKLLFCVSFNVLSDLGIYKSCTVFLKSFIFKYIEIKWLKKPNYFAGERCGPWAFCLYTSSM